MEEVTLYGIKAPLSFDIRGRWTRISIFLLACYIGYRLYLRHKQKIIKTIATIDYEEQISPSEIIEAYIQHVEELLSRFEDQTIKDYSHQLRYLVLDLHLDLWSYDMRSFDQEDMQSAEDIDEPVKTILLSIYHTPYKKTITEKKEHLETLTKDFITYLENLNENLD